jgi:hypothetical protein
VTHFNSLRSPQIASHLIVFQGALFGCWRGWRSIENSAANGGRKVVVASYGILFKAVTFCTTLDQLARTVTVSTLSKP